MLIPSTFPDETARLETSKKWLSEMNADVIKEKAVKRICDGLSSP